MVQKIRYHIKNLENPVTRTVFYEGFPQSTAVQTTYRPPVALVGFENIETGKGARGRFRPCLHTKVLFDSKSLITQGEEYGQAIAVLTAPHDINDVIGYYGLGLNGGVTTEHSEDYLTKIICDRPGFDYTDIPVKDEGRIEELARDAYRNILKRIKPTDASIVNFLLEIEDLKQVLAPFVRLKEQVNKKYREPSNSAINKFFVRMLSGGYLLFEFGLKPFVIDTAKLAQTLQRVEEKFRRINEEVSKETTEHYRVTLVPSSSEKILIDSETLPGYGGYSHYRLWKTDVEMPSEFTFTLKYKLEWKPLSSASKLVTYLLESLGVTDPLSIAWEAIPYSFLVDYFLPIGDLIDGAFKGDIEPYLVNIVDSCYSLKQETRSQYDIYFDSVLHENQVTVVNGRYERRVGIPYHTFNIPRPRLPNLGQLGIISALTAQKLAQRAVPPKWRTAFRWLRFNAVEKPYYYYGPGHSRNNPFFKKPRRYRYR